MRKHKKRRRDKTAFIIAVAVLFFLAALTVCIVLVTKYRRFTGYNVDSFIEMGNSGENTGFYLYGDGYIKCASDGVTFFNANNVSWNENFSMLQPVIDICADYIAVADSGKRNVNLYDRSGFSGRISLTHDITDVEVSGAGMVAVSTNDGDINYIEIRDRDGNEIMTEKSVFPSSGFLMDISLSDDGLRLAAVFVSVDKGTLRSRLVLYDLSGDGSGDIITAVFDDYESVLLTTVHFLDDDKLCVAGDEVVAVYSFGEKRLLYEKMLTEERMQALFFGNGNVGMILEEPESLSRYAIRVIDMYGQERLYIETDFPFARAGFAGSNVLLYSSNECLMYSFDKVLKLSLEFDQHIEALISSDGRHFVYGTNSRTEFISLR